MNSKKTLPYLLENASGKAFLFLGREGSFSDGEIERFLKKYHITLTRSLLDDVVATIEPYGLNPLEEMVSQEAYERGIPSFGLNLFERVLSESLSEKSLLMAVKLNSDQARIVRLLKNEHLSDAFFIELLCLYVWSQEEDSAEDRDVIMATLRRFIEIKPNEEDLLYSALTLNRLASNTTNPRLLEALLAFPEIRFLQRGKHYIRLKEVIATNPFIDEVVVEKLMALNEEGVWIALASNEALLISQLWRLEGRTPRVNEALASNPQIDTSLFLKLLESPTKEVVEMLLRYQPLSLEQYNDLEPFLEEEMFSFLGANEHLDEAVVEVLLQKSHTSLIEALCANSQLSLKRLNALEQHPLASWVALAKNSALSTKSLRKIEEEHGTEEEVSVALASNPSTPIDILEKIYTQKQDFKHLEALASNPTTPIEILNILKIDTRLRHALTHNERFVATITQKLGL